jgi:hypothetical protein
MKLTKEQSKGLEGFHLQVLDQRSYSLYQLYSTSEIGADGVVIDQDWVKEMETRITVSFASLHPLKATFALKDGKKIPVGSESLNVDLTNPPKELLLEFPNGIIDPVTIPFDITPLSVQQANAIAVLSSFEVVGQNGGAFNCFFLDPTKKAATATLHLRYKEGYEVGIFHSKNNEPFIIKDIFARWQDLSAEITLFDKEGKALLSFKKESLS